VSLIMSFVDHDRERAEVVTDSVAYTTNDGVRPVSFATKAIVYSHALTVMAQRGSLPFFWQVHDGLNRTFTGVDGIDGIVAALASIAPAAHADNPSFGNELHLVGYSRRHKGFAAARLLAKNDWAIEELPAGVVHCTAGGRELPPSREPPSPGLWIAAAIGLRAQCKAAAWIGGDLVQHVLTPSGIGISKIHRFSDYAETLQMIEDRWTKQPSTSSSDTETSLPELVHF
jgi:hypothetical protein